MILEEVPIIFSVDEVAQALLHQCGALHRFHTETAPATADPVTSIVMMC